jgi:hypothetical protein
MSQVKWTPCLCRTLRVYYPTGNQIYNTTSLFLIPTADRERERGREGETGEGGREGGRESEGRYPVYAINTGNCMYARRVYLHACTRDILAQMLATSDTRTPPLSLSVWRQ